MKTRNLYLAVIAVAVLAVRYFFALPEFDEKYIGSYIGQKLTFQGLIIEQPEEGEFYAQFKLKISGFKYLDAWYPAEGIVLIQTQKFSEFNYGDVVFITGILEEPLRNDPKLAGFIKNPEVKIVKTEQGNYFLSRLFCLREFLIERLDTFLPFPSSGFAAGILFGVRSGIPREVTDDFKRTGLTHILALSGFNIVILIAFIENFLVFLPRKTANALSLGFIFVFTLMVGAGASVVRAAIMGSLSLVARMCGRYSSGLRLLFIAAFLMAAFDPFIIFYDIGFQLSFAATLGLILFAERLKNYVTARFARLPRFFSDSLATTFSAQIFTLPLIIYYFKSISIITPLANLIVLPFIPILMLGSFSSIIFGKIISAPTWLLFELVLKIIHFFSSLPFSFIDFGIS
ncbi:ComEC/Rec2 family competence protein [Candidatus Peregrinibacteria bacterium]|nr:ComEC/Rec2 family competence protein [Candidatus Peregrinibacteria bacterium]